MNNKIFGGVLLAIVFSYPFSFLSAQTNTCSSIGLTRTLKQGSIGTDVLTLQKVLNTNNLTKIATTGAGSPGYETTSFGPATKLAVQKFQTSVKLKADGIAGSQTFLNMASMCNTYTGSTPVITPVQTSNTSYVFTKNLQLGAKGIDVLNLQKILNTNIDTKISASGAGSPGYETQSFGPATKSAVIKFQNKYNLSPAAGYVGPATRTKLNELSSKGGTGNGKVEGVSVTALPDGKTFVINGLGGNSFAYGGGGSSSGNNSSSSSSGSVSSSVSTSSTGGGGSSSSSSSTTGGSISSSTSGGASASSSTGGGGGSSSSSTTSGGTNASGTATGDTTIVNIPPVAFNDTNITNEENILTGNLLINDTDANSDVLSVVQFNVNGTNVSVDTVSTIPNVGTLTISSTGSYTFTPSLNYNGTVPAITYTITDGKGGSSTAVLAITVNSVNDNPVSVNDTNTILQDTIATGNVLSNDTDVDTDILSINSFKINSATYNPSSTATISGVGTLTISSTGSYTFTPNAGYSSSVPVITYTANDGKGGTVNGTLTITITPVIVTPTNTNPVANNDAKSTNEDTVATGNVLTNDTDANGDTILLTKFTINGTNYNPGIAATIPNVGTLTISSTGSYTFTPNLNYNGTVPVVTYTVSDGKGGSATATLGITVSAVNDVPLGVNNVNTILEDSNTTGNVLTNDTDADNDTLSLTTFAINGNNFNAGSNVVMNGIGTLVLNSNGSYTFNTVTNYFGTVPTITYTLSDGSLTAMATLIINVTGVNDNPSSVNDNYTTTQNVPLSNNVLSNDGDVDGDILSVTQFVVNGTTYTASSTARTITNVGTFALNTTGVYTFTPTSTYSGTVPTITYTLSDGRGGTATATLIFTVTVQANTAPVGVNDTNTVAMNSSTSGNVLTNDTDANSDTLTLTSFTVNSTSYVVSGSGSSSAILGYNTIGTTAATMGGEMYATKFTPTTNGTINQLVAYMKHTAGGDDPASIGVYADNAGKPGMLLAHATTHPNISSTASWVTFSSLSEDRTGGLNVTANTPVWLAIWPGFAGIINYYYDAGTTNQQTIGINYETWWTWKNPFGTTAAQAARKMSIYANITTTGGGTTAVIANVGSISLGSTGDYTFTPAANYSGTVPVVTYTVSDGRTGSATATLGITVSGSSNTAPVGINDTKTTAYNTAATGNVLTNDTDAQNNTLSVTQFVVNGTTYTASSTARTITNVGTFVLNTTGVYTFTPTSTYSGTVPTITYTLSDGSLTATATLIVTVSSNAPNTAPVGVNDTNTVAMNSSTSGNVLTNDTDANSDTLTVSDYLISGVSYAAGSTTSISGIGTFVINTNGSYTFTPAANYSGTVPVVTYTVSDGKGGSATATLTITITGGGSSGGTWNNSNNTFTYTLTTGAKTSAGIYDSNDILVRTLWSGVSYQAGTYTASWDRKNDAGTTVSGTGYTIRVLTNNVTYTWEGAVGNSSSNTYGNRVFRALRNARDGIVVGSNLYYAVGFVEGDSSTSKVGLSDITKMSYVMPTQNSDVNLEVHKMTSDGTYVYWTGLDPYDAAKSFTYATKVTDDSELLFSSGVSTSTIYGRTYPKVIDLNTSGSTAQATGIAVQKTGNYLYISHSGLNEIHVFNKSTGASVRTISMTTPKSMVMDGSDNIWIISGTTPKKYTINTDGTLSSPTLTLSGLVEPISMSVSPDNSTVAIADAGTSQQIKAFSNSTGSSVWTLGQAGGYSSSATVTDDKFMFTDINESGTFGFVAYQSDGSFWVGDTGNARMVHYNTSQSATERISFMPMSYSAAVDKNDPTRVFSDLLEFKIDYSKSLAGNNGSWTLVKNWRGGLNASNYKVYNDFNIFKNVITLSNGKTYGTILRSDDAPELFELTASGNLRSTGTIFDQWDPVVIQLDGSLLRFESNLGVGNSGNWTKQTLTGFSNNNPAWGSKSTVASIPTITNTDPAYSDVRPSVQTSSGMLVLFNAGKVNQGYHLGAVKVGDNKYAFKTAKSTGSSYSGAYPTDGRYDTGNTCEYCGGNVYTIDKYIFWNYVGEFWKNSQVNKWQMVNDDGLLIDVFGKTTIEAEAADGGDAPREASGNTYNGGAVKVGNDIYIYHNDESVHAGVHRWKISNLSSIQELIISAF